MQNSYKLSALLGVGAIALTLAGCQDKNNNGQPDTPATTSQIDNAASSAGSKMEGAASNAASTVSNAASDAASTASNAASSAGKAIANAGEAATMTPKVKFALDGNAGLKGVTVNVDTLGSKDSIALRGSVKTASQKNLAEMVAKKAAPGYKIINQLKVGK